MNHNLLAVLLLFISLQGLDTSTTSCDNSCETDSSCDPGFYCCNSKCVPLPGIGESCPCSRCNAEPSLLCKGGMCVFNGPNCTCNDASDCSTDGRTATCVNNLCVIKDNSGTPPTPSYVGQPCSYNMSCFDTLYCNSSNLCDYGPPDAYCRVYQASLPPCVSGYVCAANRCRPLRAVSEPCDGNEQCPTSYTCRADSASSQQICTTKGGVGDYCTEIFDCMNANCSNNACYLPAAGEPCFNGNLCADGFTCRFGQCASNATLPNGSACQRPSDCTSKICANGLCWPMSFTSGSCNVSQQCPDGRCVNGKCFSIAFYNEKCNATQVCFDQSRPCVNGTCPRLYSAYGEYCAVNEHCLFGSCISNSCGFPNGSCNVSADCGLNSICDCGICKPNKLAIYNANYYQNMYYYLANQLGTRRPTSSCFSGEDNSPACLALQAKFSCYQVCGGLKSWAFPNGIVGLYYNKPPTFHLDCAALATSNATTPSQPCCNAYNQTSCNTNPVVGCTEFHQMNFEPLLQVPEPPLSTPQSASTPAATPIISTPPQSTPSGVPTSVPSAAPVSTPSAVPTATPSTIPSTVPSSAPVAPVGPPSVVPLSVPIPLTCQCATPTPICDTTLNVCVGLRVTPIIQCVQRANNQYVAFMSYDNHQSSVVTLTDAINFLNIAVEDKPSNFAVGRPFVFPQSSFNVTSSTARQVSWYLDGFELNFDLADETLACPQGNLSLRNSNSSNSSTDVTFVMTSSAAVDQLQAISDDIIGNLSSIMSIPESRLNVTFSSASTKRQTSTSLITVVVLSSSSTSEPTPFAAALQFIETGASDFIARVPAASVEQVTAVPLPNEHTGSETLTPPTSDEAPKQSPPPSQSPRAVVSLAQSTIVHLGTIVLAFAVLFS